MPQTYLLPDDPILVVGTPENPKFIGGTGDITIDGKALKGSVVVDKAVSVFGPGAVVTTREAPPEPPRKPRKKRPSEVKAAKAKKKAPAKKKKGKK